MKTTPRQLLFSAALACFGALTLAALAQTPSAPTPAAPAAVAADQPEPAAAAPTAAAPSATTSAASSSTSTTTSDTAVTPAPAPTPDANAATNVSQAGSTKGTPPSESASPVAAPAASAAAPASETAAPATQAPATAPTETAPAEAAPDSTLRRIDEPAATPDTKNGKPERQHRRRGTTRSSGDNPIVQIMGNAHLGPGENADTVVAICGNATSEGKVAEAVVAVCGNARATGPVGESVVAVLGNVYVDAPVGEVVAVLGNVELGPNAEVARDVVTVGGTLKRDPKAVVHGAMPSVGIAHFGLPQGEWFSTYVHECLLKGRPLAIAPHLGWLWTIAGSFLALYIVLALLFRGGVEKSMATLETRPGGTILAALLTLLLTPVLVLLLIFTVVGVAVLPFLFVALACATVFGKVVVLAWLGKQVTRPFGSGVLSHPAVGVLIGGVILFALYLVPVLGLVMYKIVGVLGLGIVVYTLIGERRNRPPAPAFAGVPVGAAAVGDAATIPPGAGGSAAGIAAVPAVVAPGVAAATLPRAGFWIRIGALFIDCIIALLAAIFLPIGPGVLVLLAVYGALMWKFKGTTVGGIICGLQVVRLDGRPIDWPTAIVRALSCFLSLFAVGLGFIWVAIDDEKQSWHDKIAGTTVVMSRGASLV